MDFHTYPDRDMLYLSVANRIAAQLAHFLRRNERATLAVPGGETPGPLFDILSGVDLDWSRVWILPTDERWIGGEAEQSNTRLVRERLLRDRAAKAQLIPLYLPGVATPEEAVPELTRNLQPHLPISVLLLGMGKSMHTASLYASGDNLSEALKPNAPPLIPMRSEITTEPRITLTARILREAFNIHVMITGKAKKSAIERAMELPSNKAPIRCVLDLAEVHWAE